MRSSRLDRVVGDTRGNFEGTRVLEQHGEREGLVDLEGSMRLPAWASASETVAGTAVFARRSVERCTYTFTLYSLQWSWRPPPRGTLEYDRPVQRSIKRGDSTYGPAGRGAALAFAPLRVNVQNVHECSGAAGPGSIAEQVP